MFFLLIAVPSVYQTLGIRLGSYERCFCDLHMTNCIDSSMYFTGSCTSHRTVQLESCWTLASQYFPQPKAGKHGSALIVHSS